MSVQAVTVDANGISVKSFNEIRSALESDYKSVFSDLNTDPSSPDGMVIDLLSYAIMEVAQNIQSIFSNLDLNTSSGSFLSNLAYIAGFPRNFGEDDESLRIRLANSKHTGLATVENMKSFLMSEGIDALISENVSGIEQGGMPSSSIAIFIQDDFVTPQGWNGTNEDFIANAIWMCKPAGIRTFGNHSGTVVDSWGNSHTIFFDFIQPTPIFLKVEIKTYDEELLPSNYEQLIKESVASWAKKKFTPGKDIIPQRFCVPIYENVDGIENVCVLSRMNAESEWNADIIRIDPNVLARFSEELIEVVFA